MGSSKTSRASLASIRLRAWIEARDPARFPADDQALGDSLFKMVGDSLKKGFPTPALFVLRAGQVDRFSLKPILAMPLRQRNRYLAGLAGQDAVECVALLGTLRLRGRGPLAGQRVAVVFIEWPDNRWWNAWQVIGENGALLGDGPNVQCAVEGSPRPSGVGGWFALARRSGVQLYMEKQGTPVH